MKKKDGGPAFPVMAEHEIYRDSGYHKVVYPEGGMTLRDYLAAAVVSEVLRVYAADNKCGVGVEHLPRNVAAHAYRVADAMLAEREK